MPPASVTKQTAHISRDYDKELKKIQKKIKKDLEKECRKDKKDENDNDGIEILDKDTKEDATEEKEEPPVQKGVMEMEFDLMLGKSTEQPVFDPQRLKKNPKLIPKSHPFASQVFLNDVQRNYEGKYDCPKCNLAFHGRNSLNEHYKIVHVNMFDEKDEQVVCVLNNMTQKRDLDFVCSSCEVKYNNKGSLHRHILVYHPNELRGIQKRMMDMGFEQWKKVYEPPKIRVKQSRRKNRFGNRIILTDYD